MIEGLEGSPAHTPVTEGELHRVSGSYKEKLMDIFKMDLIDWFGEVLTCAPESPASPAVSAQLMSSRVPVPTSLSRLSNQLVPHLHLH